MSGGTARWGVEVTSLGRRGFAVAVVAMLATAGCGVGAKDAQAKRIRQSRVEVAGASPAAGEVTFQLRLDERVVDELESTERLQLQAALAAGGLPSLTVRAFVNGKDRRAAVLLGPEGEEPATVFADTELFAKRQNARPSERRTWARLDIAELTEEERPLDVREMTTGQVLTALASTVNPAYLLDLVAGTLTGSVKVRGTEVLGEVETTRYEMNISLEKALTELNFDDDQQAVRTRLFYLLGSRQEVIPSRAWIDGDGRLRRLELELDQQVTRRRKNQLLVRLDLSAFDAQTTIDRPDPEITVTYERFGRLVRSVLPEGA
jgi:hypothetical protein